MTRACALNCLLAGAICAGGCGTFADAMCGGPPDDRVIYRGVWIDMQAAKEGYPQMLLDLPFSAVADTCLIPSAIKRERELPERRARQVSESTGGKPWWIVEPAQAVANQSEASQERRTMAGNEGGR